jgi:hypothetical protein
LDTLRKDEHRSDTLTFRSTTIDNISPLNGSGHPRSRLHLRHQARPLPLPSRQDTQPLHASPLRHSARQKVPLPRTGLPRMSPGTIMSDQGRTAANAVRGRQTDFPQLCAAHETACRLASGQTDLRSTDGHHRARVWQHQAHEGHESLHPARGIEGQHTVVVLLSGAQHREDRHHRGHRATTDGLTKAPQGRRRAKPAHKVLPPRGNRTKTLRQNPNSG